MLFLGKRAKIEKINEMVLRFTFYNLQLAVTQKQISRCRQPFTVKAEVWSRHRQLHLFRIQTKSPTPSLPDSLIRLLL